MRRVQAGRTIGAGLVMSTLVMAGTALSVTGQESRPVTMWGWPTSMAMHLDADGQDELAALIKAATGVDVEITLVEQPDLGPKLKAALPAGTGPDLLLTDFDVMNPYWSFTEPLDGYAEAAWGADWRSRFTSAALDEVGLVGGIAGTPDQTRYLPGNMQLLGWIVYSQGLFEQAGLDAASIATYADFLAACDTLKGAGITPLAIGSHPAGLVDLFQTLVEVSAPGKLERAQVGDMPFTDPDIARAFDLIAEVFSRCAPEGAIGTDIGQGVFPPFFRNEMAMSLQFTGTPWFGFLASPDEATRDLINNDLAVIPFPESKGLAATDAGVAIVAASSNKDAAWKVLEWIVAGPGAERKAAAGEPMGWAGYQSTAQGTPFDTAFAAPLYQALETGSNKFRRILCPAVYQELSTVIPGVVTGQISADLAAGSVQAAFDRSCQDWVG